MPKERLPAFDDEEQVCSACTYVAVMVATVHEVGCAGHPPCEGTKWGLRQQPHMGRRCPRCDYTWAEERVDA